MELTEAVGRTVMLKLVGIPLQLFDTGTTVMLAVMGKLLLLVRVNPLILPAPLLAKPIDGLLLVQ